MYRLWRLFQCESAYNIQAVRRSAKACGVIGMKMLQFLVMYDGFLSATGKEGFRDVLENCEAHSWDYSASVYTSTFKRDISDDYDVDAEGAKIPIGSGSIGQVYKLRDKVTGEYVAMKVRHPGVATTARMFVDNLMCILRIWKVPFSVIIYECLASIKLQLNYLDEAQNMRMVRDVMSSEKHMVIPKVIAATDEIIIMSYHDGVQFTEIKDKKLRFKIANDIFLFMTTSFVCYNFVHCDMHYGNWKVDPVTKNIVVYDCGVIGRLGRKYDPNLVKDFIMGAFSGDLLKVAYCISCDLDRDPRGWVLRRSIDDLLKRPYKHQSDRFADFIKKAVESGVDLDRDVLRCFQGMIICRSTFSVSRDYIMSLLVDDDKSYSEILLCLNYMISSRTGEWKPLSHHFERWMEEDPNIEKNFLSWMENCYGHTDKEALTDVLIKHLGM